MSFQNQENNFMSQAPVGQNIQHFQQQSTSTGPFQQTAGAPVAAGSTFQQRTPQLVTQHSGGLQHGIQQHGIQQHGIQQHGIQQHGIQQSGVVQGSRGVEQTTSYTTQQPYQSQHSYQQRFSSGQQNIAGSVTGQFSHVSRTGGKDVVLEEYSTTGRFHEGMQIMSERIVEHEVKVPKRIVREDVIEKVIVVPEKVVHEEIIEETQRIRERIVQVAKPVIQEKIVEVPEIEYVERIVEVTEKVIQEKIREVPRVEIQERIIEVPKIVQQERIVEVPEYEYRDIPVEKIVEVPEIREQIVTREVPVPQYVDKPVPEYVTVEVPKDVDRSIPVPVEAISTYEFLFPSLQPRYKKVDLPLYVPRFIEVPVPAEFMEMSMLHQAEHYSTQVKVLSQQTAASLCEVENLAGAIKNTDFSSFISKDISASVKSAWMSGRLGNTN